MQLRLVASCIALGGLPIRAAIANELRAVVVLPGSPVFRLEVSVDPPFAAAPPRSGEINSVAMGMGLRMDMDYAQPRSKPDVMEAVDHHAQPNQSATASAPRTVKLLLGDSLIHDSNVLRLPGNVGPSTAGVTSKSDTIHSAYVGLSIDKAYAQQRVELDVTETVYRYANLTSLNFDAFEYRGAWHWHLTPRWGGTLRSERRIALASFADSQFSQRNQRNLRTTDNYSFSLDGSLFGGWHVLFGVYQYQTKYDQGFLPQNSSRTLGAEAGIKYESAAGRVLSVMQRSIQGEYLNRVPDAANFSDNSFRQNDTELKLDWNLSGKSAIRSRLTWVNVRHEHISARDFSGLTGELGNIWTPTSKLRVEIVAKRDIASWWQTSSSYKIDDSLSITPTWQVSAKTSVRARLERMQSDFRGPVFPPLGAQRRDTVQNAQLGMDWSPLRNVVLDARLQRQWRSSNFSEVAFDASVASINAKLKF
jgi:exopolysaccharide biosynthesis operon protein EpsL